VVGSSSAAYLRSGGAWTSLNVDTEQQLERVRVQGGRVYVVGLQGQVLWRPEP
jgi:hypothetical protein